MPPPPVTRAEISRSRLVGNFERLRALVRATPGGERCGLLAVVKADAYGHGLSLCAPGLVEAGAEWIGVTSVQEGVAARRLCPETKILVMSGILPGEEDALLDARLTPTVWDCGHLEELAAAAAERKSLEGSIPVHLEIDTGMSRQGVGPLELEKFLDRLRGFPALRLDGVFTHFASPEVLDSEQNAAQMGCFERAMEQVRAAGLQPEWVHAGNSSSVLGRRTAQSLAAVAAGMGARCMMRPGLALYGYALPFVCGWENVEIPVELHPVLSWKTKISSVRTVEAGTGIGYNATFVAPRTMHVALLPVGYADGLNRKLSNRGHVLVRGQAAPIVGRISMDLTVVDVSDLADAKAGEEVVILGEQNGVRVTADDHARWAETITYEILCAIGGRVPRLAVP
jgi:alanine racemase